MKFYIVFMHIIEHLVSINIETRTLSELKTLISLNKILQFIIFKWIAKAVTLPLVPLLSYKRGFTRCKEQRKEGESKRSYNYFPSQIKYFDPCQRFRAFSIANLIYKADILISRQFKLPIQRISCQKTLSCIKQATSMKKTSILLFIYETEK